MATNSAIEWTDTTWRPVTGCTKISPGCKHCYAEQMSRRLQASPGYHRSCKRRINLVFWESPDELKIEIERVVRENFLTTTMPKVEA